MKSRTKHATPPCKIASPGKKIVYSVEGRNRKASALSRRNIFLIAVDRPLRVFLSSPGLFPRVKPGNYQGPFPIKDDELDPLV